MRLYKLTFNEYTNCLKDTIGQHGDEKIQPRYITIDNSVLYVAVMDFEELKQLDVYGKGIKTVEFIGGVLILESQFKEAL